MYIAFHSATMLMLGPSTFLEDEEDEDEDENSNLSLQQVVKLTYYWVYKTRQDTVRRELKIVCEETLVDWYNLCREVCSEIIEKDNDKVGGPGKIVEIDESKFGKRKNHSELLGFR